MGFIQSKNFTVFIYSASLVLLWGICFRAFEATQLTCGIGLILTFVSSYFLQRQYDLSILNKLAVLILPLAYSLVFFIKDDYPFFLTPFFVGLIFLVFNLFVFNDLRKLTHNIFFVLLTMATVQYLFPAYKTKVWNLNDQESVLINKEIKNQPNKAPVLSENFEIENFSFLNSDGKKAKIVSEKPFLFIQTVEDNCAPCKKAVIELSPILDTMNTKVESFYLYHANNFKNEKFQKFLDSNKNLDGKNVLADEKSEFFDNLNISADPTFLIIDNQSAEILFMAVGFGKKEKEAVLEKLNKISEIN